MPRPARRITSDRLSRLRAAASAGRVVTSARSKVLELVFAAGSGQFNQRMQLAIQGLIANKKDRPIVALVFASGRLLFGEPVKEAIARVADNPGDVEGVVELVLVFPEQMVGVENDQISPFMRALVTLGVDRDALLLVQDITLTTGEVARLFVSSALAENQGAILPGLMRIAGEAWPEIQGDVERLQD